MNNLPGSMSKYLLIILLALTLAINVGCSTPRTKPANVIDRSGNSVESTPPGYYRVKRGDTLTRIALDHGQAPRDLVIWNNLANPNQIEIGDLILIQSPGKSKSAAASSAPKIKSEVIKPESVTAEAPKEPAADPSIALSWPAKGKVVEEFSEQNKGIDIAGKLGESVVAASDGKVVYAGNSLRGYGNLVIVKHNNTYLTAYAHNRVLSVKEGQMVKRGQKIAEMGDTDSNSIKLHFELRVNGKPVNPMPYLQ
uniref:peptidoglycan DD-metalloendopeptidase family protein n=1 Tax=Polynucleobacter sp. TaxID=2029855 RepID=UPI0040481F00